MQIEELASSQRKRLGVNANDTSIRSEEVPDTSGLVCSYICCHDCYLDLSVITLLSNSAPVCRPRAGRVLVLLFHGSSIEILRLCYIDYKKSILRDDSPL